MPETLVGQLFLRPNPYGHQRVCVSAFGLKQSGHAAVLMHQPSRGTDRDLSRL